MQLQINELYTSLENHPLSTSAKLHGLHIKLSAHYIDVIKDLKIVRVTPKHLIYAGDIISSFYYYFSAVK